MCYGKEFTDRLFGLRRRAATGNHDFDRLCADLAIEHRLAPPMHPQSEPLSAIDGVDGSRSRHRNVPHWVLSQTHRGSHP